MVAAALCEWLGVEATDVTRARSGKKEPDVALSPAAASKFPYHVEVKNHKKLTPSTFKSWIDQAIDDSITLAQETSTPPKEPIVVYSNGGKLRVATRFVHLAQLLSVHAAEDSCLVFGDGSYIDFTNPNLADLWSRVDFPFFMELATNPNLALLDG